MCSLVKRGWATGFSLLRRISDLKSTRQCADRKLIARMMMSTAVNSTPSSSSRVMSPPWLMLPPVFSEGGDMIYKFYNLSEDKEESFPKNRSNSEEEIADDDANFVGSSHGWLALFNKRNNHLFLYNPITSRHIKLPPIETLPDPSINLAPDGRGSVHKLILSSSPDDDDECIAMMIFGPECRLAFCHPCHSIKWTPIGELYDHDYVTYDGGMSPRCYQDIVYSSTRKLFFARPSDGNLECWDLSDSLSPRIHSSFQVLCPAFPHSVRNTNMVMVGARRKVNLVYAEEYNQLFLVMQYVMDRLGPDSSYVHPIYYGKNRGWDNSFPYRTIYLNAVKADFGVEKPKVLRGSLDGLAMFVGLNHSIAMSPTPESKLSSNCIYYTDSNENHIPENAFYGGHDIGIFDYTKRKISPCYDFPLDVKSIKRIMPAPMWFTPCHH
ncbi:hypothetical protein CASFOL_001117 [Castilleja foliolosa]|uniref:KIB1-4 beta-propeller domain-containing protein n=1 Tax=Castilleja foliolosa TaxID=1961234 RepID=A0ABD3EPY8_9LAMI